MIIIRLAVSGMIGESRAESGNKVVQSNDTESQVRQIREWYNEIESDQSLVRLEIEPKEESAMMSKFTRFTNRDGVVKKVVMRILSDHGVSEESYYFQAGKLIFVYETGSYWKFSGKGTEDNPGTVDVGSQMRYYFSGGKCVKGLKKRVESEDQKKLSDLLAKAKNKPVVDKVMAARYQKQAVALLRVKTLEDLEKYLAQKFE